MKRLLGRQSIIDLLFTSGIRKTLVILIFSCMVINGFIPKSIENKNSLFMVMTAVVSNAVTDIFEECRDTLTLISNKITKDLYKMLSLGEVSTTSPIENTDDKEPMPVNTSSDNGIMTEKRVSGHWNSGESRIEKDWYGEPIIISKLYRLYENIKIYDGAASKLGVLFFILFIGVIRSRKEISIKKTNGVKEYKTDLCL
ncbi:MAG: hypothetical protein VB017_06940 [Endomicrobiaceae bacterium]|nr:hypothetical protein [Endomicrobiaceae bacterium]